MLEFFLPYSKQTSSRPCGDSAAAATIVEDLVLAQVTQRAKEIVPFGCSEGTGENRDYRRTVVSLSLSLCNRTANKYRENEQAIVV